MPELGPPPRARTCNEDDLDSVLEIEAKSFTDPYDRGMFLHLLRLEPEGFLVAEGGGDILGYVVVSARFGLVFSLAVSGEHRRKGIGLMLMKAALTYLRGRTERVSLQVRASNIPATSLYRRLAFQEDGLLEEYYRDGEDALVMSLRLRRRRAGSHASVEVGDGLVS